MQEEQNSTAVLDIQFDHEAWRDAMPKHISRRQLARAIGTTDSNLIAIETGRSKPSILLAFRYCNFTHLPVSSLVKK